MSSLAPTVAHDKALRAELLRRFPSIADDEDALLDTLDGLSDFADQVIALVRAVDDDRALVAGIKARIAELTERGKRLEARAEKRLAAALNAMLEAGRTKIEAPDWTLSAARAPATVVVTDEAAIPPAYMRQPDPPAPRPDKTAIKAALDRGEDVPGAALSNGGHRLQIRRK